MGRKIKIFLLGCVLLCFNSCGLFFYNYYQTAEGGRRAILPNYKLAKPSPYTLQPNSLIDTGAIYISHNKIFFTNGKVFEQCIGIRFFADGRCFYSVRDSIKDLSVNLLNNIARAMTPGYYRIENGNEIRIENFGLLKHYNEIRWAKYTNYRGYFKGDTLLLFVDFKKNKPFPKLRYENGFPTNGRIYIPHKVKGLKGQADW